MLILNCGLQRSGTVLCGSIAKALLKSRNISFHSHNHGSTEPVGLLKLVNQSKNKPHYLYQNIVIHTHAWSPELSQLVAHDPAVRVMVSFRDPRDVCVSLKKLHEISFKHALAISQNTAAVNFPLSQKGFSLSLRYEELIADKKAHISRIAEFLGLKAGEKTIAEVDQVTSVQAHRNIMNRVADTSSDTAVREIPNAHRTLREDPESHISDRHIQSGQIGRWRQEMSDDEQQTANETLKPLLLEMGYF